MAQAVCIGIIFLQNAVHDGFKLFFLRAIDNVLIFLADERAVGWNRDDIQVVNFCKLRRFGFRGAGHAGEFFVHAEIILESDGSERLIFTLDLYALFGFNGLVQAV